MEPGDMASAKRIPKMSRISRDQTVAYARKQKPPADEGGEASGVGGAGDDAPEPAAKPGEATPVSAKEVPAPSSAPPASSKEVPGPKAATAMPVATEPGAPATATITPPPPSVEPWPDATPVPMKPVEPGPAVADTVAPPVQASSGAPLKISVAATGAAVDVGAAEDPTRMPGPREIPTGSPDEPAPPPGRVPPGDSRSLRRRTERHEFVLIYRIQTHVISRIGEVGTRGQWRVVEYPTQASASHAYAKQCSRFVSEGFSDYRA